MSGPTRHDALRYAELGFAVLPLRPRGKRPTTERGVLDATRDTGRISEWFRETWEEGDPNLGVRMGPDFVGLDIDYREGGQGTWTELLQKHGQGPETIEHQTGYGDGSRHVIYSLPPEFRAAKEQIKLGPGVVARTGNQYLVAPPSWHESGRPYILLSRVPAAPAPEWLLDRLIQAEIPDARIQGNGLVELLNTMPQRNGEGRNIAFTRLAGYLATRAHSLDEALALMRSVNDGLIEPRDERDNDNIMTRIWTKEITKTWIPIKDDELADWIMTRTNDRLRYVPKTREWFRWRGTLWDSGSDDDICQAGVREALSEAQAILNRQAREEINEPKKKALSNQEFKLSRAHTLFTMTRAVKSVEHGWMTSGEFDRNPYLLNCPNGMVDLRSGRLLAHDPMEFQTRQTKVPYDPDAKAPMFEAFLAEILPDEETRDWVHRMMGLTLVGRTLEEGIIFAYGEGANGKSTLLNIVSGILGDYSEVVDISVIIGDAPAHVSFINDLMGLRLAIAAETKAGAGLSTDRLKRYFSKEDVKSRVLYSKKNLLWSPSHTLWFMSNHPPYVLGIEEGIRRRMRVLPFKVTIPRERRIPRFEDNILANEGPGVLAWMVRGFQAYAVRGAVEPESVRQATEDYFDLSDPLTQWRDECTRDLRPDEAMVNRPLLYASFQAWQKDNGMRPWTSSTFYRELGRFCEATKIRQGDAYIRTFKGITLRDPLFNA